MQTKKTVLLLSGTIGADSLDDVFSFFDSKTLWNGDWRYFDVDETERAMTDATG